MKKVTKIAIGTISLIALGTALYFFVFKKTASDYRKMIMDFLKSENLSKPSVDSKDVINKFQDLTDNKMTEQELKDTYVFLYMSKYPNTNQKYKNDTAFNARISDLSKKYNIFS
jgi:hypothetical protein